MYRLRAQALFVNLSKRHPLAPLVHSPPETINGERKYHAETATHQAPVTAARTSVTHPGLHGSDHIGLWYTVEPERAKQVFPSKAISKAYDQQCQTFEETSLMVRQPALTVIDYIKRSNLDLPPNKFMFYGENGTGKSTSLLHVMHYLVEDGWVVLHLPWPALWRRILREILPSQSNPGRFDHPIEASAWLQIFKSQNSELLKTLQLETIEKYAWSRQVQAEIGSPLMDLVEVGLSRSKFATDAIMAITTELKRHAVAGRCKVALTVDGINTFFCPTTRHLREDRTIVPPEEFTLFQAFMQLMANDWRNGCIVGTIDPVANDDKRRASYLPRYVLRQKGWETLDPFVPVLVSKYSDTELQSAIDYYLDRRWLQHPAAATDLGRQELSFLCGHNPQALIQICNGL